MKDEGTTGNEQRAEAVSSETLCVFHSLFLIVHFSPNAACRRNQTGGKPARSTNTEETTVLDARMLRHKLLTPD